MTRCAAGFRNRACIACSLPPVGWHDKLIALKGFEPATPNSDLTFVRNRLQSIPGKKGRERATLTVQTALAFFSAVRFARYFLAN
ncbi:hypothetical protein RHECIAT_PC0000711 (plasmid) [Rhizobium etli CIAT 652]|uniref:Uncharacterized protein n=1 Tax=Rhizobium etli (strain CIAT 652) TaxID=491916 RepID=B3Q3N1_RHIE6|nr:hypothetical protein RHECIAT_PC0000711 [Rhizobium etli CIAT 652]